MSTEGLCPLTSGPSEKADANAAGCGAGQGHVTAAGGDQDRAGEDAVALLGLLHGDGALARQPLGEHISELGRHSAARSESAGSGVSAGKDLGQCLGASSRDPDQDARGCRAPRRPRPRPRAWNRDRGRGGQGGSTGGAAARARGGPGSRRRKDLGEEEVRESFSPATW